MKKVAFSVIATGSLALFVGTDDAEASSYQVKAGDSLWKIASENKLSISTLKQLNGLTSDVIFPNQTLQVAPTTTNQPVQNKPTQVTQSKPSASTSTYTVKSGDTLSKIASQYKMTVGEIQRLNNIPSHLIFAGQQLKVSGTAQTPSQSKPVVTTPATPPPATTNGSYRVIGGDTLSGIAYKQGTSVTQLKNWNNLRSDSIYVGQVLKVENNGVATQPNTPPAVTTPPPASANGSYRVVSGDTLSGIAYKRGISVTQLKNWNNLKTNLIYVGQVLKVENGVVATQPNTPPTVTTPPPTQSASGSVKAAINLAMSLQGTPYVWGGSTPSGFDCSGFLYYVYSKSGIDIPRTNTVGYDARSYEVDKPQVGDLVFFKNTYQAGISHAGIYIGNNQFIHAGGDRVQVTSLNNSYWSKHFDSFKRLYALN